MATRYKDRITILEDAEIEELYGRPRFAHDERVHYFALTPEERAVADGHYSLASRVLFILQELETEHSCPAMPLRQTVHTCRVRASSNLLGQSIHFMALANAEFVKPLEPNKKPPGTEMFDRRHPLALRRRRPVTLVQGAVT